MLPPYGSLGKISHWPRVVHNLPQQRWTFRPSRKPMLCFQTVGLLRNLSRNSQFWLLAGTSTYSLSGDFPRGLLKIHPTSSHGAAPQLTLQIAPQTRCVATYLPASPARAGYPQPQPARSFSPCSSAGGAELPRTEPQEKGEAEAGFRPVTHPLGHDPASSRGGESKRMGQAGWVSPHWVHAHGLANRAAAPGAFLPHPKKDPKRRCFIVVFCIVFVGTCFCVAWGRSQLSPGGHTISQQVSSIPVAKPAPPSFPYSLRFP